MLGAGLMNGAEHDFAALLRGAAVRPASVAAKSMASPLERGADRNWRGRHHRLRPVWVDATGSYAVALALGLAAMLLATLAFLALGNARPYQSLGCSDAGVRADWGNAAAPCAISPGSSQSDGTRQSQGTATSKTICIVPLRCAIAEGGLWLRVINGPYRRPQRRHAFTWMYSESRKSAIRRVMVIASRKAASRLATSNAPS